MGYNGANDAVNPTISDELEMDTLPRLTVKQGDLETVWVERCFVGAIVAVEPTVADLLGGHIQRFGVGDVCQVICSIKPLKASRLVLAQEWMFS